MKESTLQDKIINYLRDRGAFVVNIYGSGMTGKGVPDLLVCYRGKFIGVECKVGKNKLSPAQIIQRERILRAGGACIVPYTFEEFIKQFEAVMEDE